MQLRWIKIDVSTAEVKQRPSFFMGSMLRGAIGHALKRVTCINPSYQCEGCFSAKTCLYYDFYEKKNTTHPFRLGISLNPTRYDFSFYLFEKATASLPYILSAILKAFDEVGLKKEQLRIPITAMHVDGVMVYDGKQFLSLDAVKPNELFVEALHSHMTLKFVTPLRIKEQNRYARHSVALHTVVKNIQNRFHQLKGEEPAGHHHHIKGEIVRSSLKFIELKRYSNRQKQAMNFDGLKGEIEIEGLDKQSYFYLKIGEIIGAGKQTVFGLGDYRLLPNKEGK